MTSLVEFSTGEFRAKRGMKSPLKWHNQPWKKWRTFRKSKESTCCYGDPFFQQFRLHLPPQGNWVEFTFAQTSGLSITFTSNGQTRICTTWPSLPFTCRLLFITSTHKFSFTQFFIHKNCFELFLSAHLQFEKFSTWIRRLPYTWSLNSLIAERYVPSNDSRNNNPFYSYGWKRDWSWRCFDTNLLALLCESCCC